MATTTKNVVHVTTLTKPDSADLFSMRLAGVAVDSRDNLYVLGDDRVLCFTPAYALDREMSVDGLGWSLLAEADTLWIGFDGRLSLYNAHGELQNTIRDPGRLGRATAIAAAGGILVVADSTNRAVQRYSREGKYLGELGAEANTRGFMIPNGVLDLVGDASNQTILIAHPQKHRVERYESTGPLVAKWGRFGMHEPGDFGGCCNPTNIAVATDGTIAVSEKAPPRVKLYGANGEFQQVIDQEVFDQNTKNIDLAFDSRNRLYATDPARRVVEVFQFE
ncbi:MAG: hypothetical protein KDA60_04655 [Planctomycetales bacterium]|nr:hypothetical protein [Planctomycetales bacterium]